MSTNTISEFGVDQLVFRNVVGHFASGVTVITTVVDGELFGTTASAVSSLSMEPPMMLACLNRSSSTHDAVVKAGWFGINILAEDQEDVCRVFAAKGTDKFAGMGYKKSGTGSPILDGVLAWIDCEMGDIVEEGDHYVVVGRVRELEVVLGQKAPDWPIEDAIANMRVIDAIFRSAGSGRWETVSA